ncbi:peptidyl-prolyl cis-trans isomerase [Winogradskyella sp. DF17]|uniref:Peptidyl-prolyl cis-trans isomerase n=2 Tax=Winogradskyella pelagia TaxID=2819984 RepID=A0ABS3T7V9_9FLAO|nr:peptidyl-prolyl cis-trans isomerase [Winogradskyella sp. DF17]MBO3117835.1 peptidyl-prolyl cis-trans isomerase [Winogradskyella sp. DF17]
MVFLSCDFFEPKEDKIPVARVNETYLYTDDVEDVVPLGASRQDSTLIMNAYINRWAKQLLLMEGALQNLPERQQIEFSKLIDQYKSDLYTKAYLEALVKKSIDTLVDPEEAEQFYEVNKESYKLNDDLIKFRYISMPLNPINLDTIKKRFKRFEQKDQRYLDSISVQFKSYLLNDSIWVKLSNVVDKVSVVNANNKEQLLKKTNFLQLKDSINLYLMQVNDVRLRNDYAPLEYVNSSIQQIVINKRKLELIKQLENEITKDAIKNKQFEIYN